MDFAGLGERATDGTVVYPNMAAIAYAYDGSGNLITQTMTQYGRTFVKTFTYVTGNLTNESLWVGS